MLCTRRYLGCVSDVLAVLVGRSNPPLLHPPVHLQHLCLLFQRHPSYADKDGLFLYLRTDFHHLHPLRQDPVKTSKPPIRHTRAVFSCIQQHASTSATVALFSSSLQTSIKILTNPSTIISTATATIHRTTAASHRHPRRMVSSEPHSTPSNCSCTRLAASCMCS